MRHEKPWPAWNMWATGKHTHTYTHTHHINSNTHTSHTHSHTHNVPYLCLSLSVSLSHLLARSLTCALSLSLSHPLSFSLGLCLCLLSLSLSLTTHTQTHTHTHTHESLCLPLTEVLHTRKAIQRFVSITRYAFYLTDPPQYEETCNSNVRVNMLYHLCIGIVALITVLTPSNFRAERTQTKGDTTCNRTSELQVSLYLGIGNL